MYIQYLEPYNSNQYIISKVTIWSTTKTSESPTNDASSRLLRMTNVGVPKQHLGNTSFRYYKNRTHIEYSSYVDKSL